MRIRNNKCFNVSIQGKHNGVGMPARAMLPAGSVLELEDDYWKDNFAESESVKSSIKSGAFEIVKAPALSEAEAEARNVEALEAATKLLADHKAAEAEKAAKAKEAAKVAAK